MGVAAGASAPGLVTDSEPAEAVCPIGKDRSDPPSGWASGVAGCVRVPGPLAACATSPALISCSPIPPETDPLALAMAAGASEIDPPVAAANARDVGAASTTVTDATAALSLELPSPRITLTVTASTGAARAAGPGVSGTGTAAAWAVAEGTDTSVSGSAAPLAPPSRPAASTQRARRRFIAARCGPLPASVGARRAGVLF
eukprot:scaffold19707_cov90-Isochrysis_galbana.AAC.2